jgi:hypothetical protein
MFDTEFALGIYRSGGIEDPFDKILNGSDKGHFNNQLFKALLANPDFRSQFAATMTDLCNNNFHSNSFTPKLNNYAAVYKPLMDDYFTRWGRPWPSVYQNKVDDARKYLNAIRNTMISTYLPKYCN